MEDKLDKIIDRMMQYITIFLLALIPVLLILLVVELVLCLIRMF